MALPLDGAFLRRIYLGDFWGFAKEEPFDVIEEEILGVGIREIQSVVINYLTLLLQPTTPTDLANLTANSLPQLVWEWSKANRWSFLTAMYALNRFGHISIIELQFSSFKSAQTRRIAEFRV